MSELNIDDIDTHVVFNKGLVNDNEEKEEIVKEPSYLEMCDIEDKAYKAWLEVQEYINANCLEILHGMTFNDFLHEFYLDE